MEALGLLAELSGGAGRSRPSLLDLTDGLDQSTKAAVIDYLKRGVEVFDVMEATPDPLRPGSSIPGGSSLLTDGYWVWRLDLPNYVEAYNLALPEAFLADVVKGGRIAGSKLAISESIVKDAIAAHGWI